MSIKLEMISLQQAQAWARLLEDKAAARHGLTIKEARAIVSRETRVATGTLENLRNGRLKAVLYAVHEKLKGGVIREIEAERVVLEHELQVLRASGADPGGAEMVEAQTHLARARQILGRDR